MKSNLPKVAVAYLTWPHYRAGIGQAMRGSSCYSYHLVGSDENISPSIPIWEGWRNGPHTVAPLVPLPWGWWQRRIVPLAFDSSVDAIVLMALPGALSHWCCAALCAVTGKPVLVWTHGWTRIDSVQTTIAKRLLYSLPRALLLYSKRAKMLGIDQGEYKVEKRKTPRPFRGAGQNSVLVFYFSRTPPRCRQSRRRRRGARPQELHGELRERHLSVRESSD